MHALTLTSTILLLGVAAVVAILAHRLRLPYTVGLVLCGFSLALVHVRTGEALTRELIFNALLPPLLYEAALNIRWQELRRDALPVTILATLGVVLSAAVVTAGMVFLVRWPLSAALIFGVLIAATDPVSVIATFRDARIKGRVRLIVEAESLFNDGVAAVLFVLALAYAQVAAEGGGVTQPLTLGYGAWLLVKIALGGAVVGAAVGGLAILLTGRTLDPLVETTLTTVAAYGSFILAEHFHMSGVLAAVAAGLLMGNLGVFRAGDKPNVVSEQGREAVIAFWDFAAFVVNSLIFLLIGLRIARIPFHKLGLPALVAAIALVLLGRMATVYPLSQLFARTRYAIDTRMRHVLFWGGLRGALALALALSLPIEMPYRDQIFIAAFGVVAFSMIVQGITMPALLRRLGYLSPHRRLGNGPGIAE